MLFRNVRFRWKKIDNSERVYWMYFVSPLTHWDYNPSSILDWQFYLRWEERHLISQRGITFSVLPSSVWQYVLTNQKSVEFYEWDIVKHKCCNFCFPPRKYRTLEYRDDVIFWENIYIVKYSYDWFDRELIIDNTPKWVKNSYVLNWSWDSCEKIWNMTDNPQLLTKKNI